jgi:hypothetical protein
MSHTQTQHQEVFVNWRQVFLFCTTLVMELIQGRRIEVLWEFGESKKKRKVWRGSIVTKPSRSTLTMSPQSAMIRYDAMCSKTDMNVRKGVGGIHIRCEERRQNNVDIWRCAPNCLQYLLQYLSMFGRGIIWKHSPMFGDSTFI